MKKIINFVNQHKKIFITGSIIIILIFAISVPIIIKQKPKYDADKNLEEHFGNTSLSNKELDDLAKDIVYDDSSSSESTPEPTSDNSDTSSESDSYSDVLTNYDFKYAIAEKLAEINAENINDIKIINREKLDDDDFQYKVKVVTDKRNLIVTISYFSVVDRYSVISIENAKNKHTYYIPEDCKYLSDIYDYDTDKIISHASKKSKKKK